MEDTMKGKNVSLFTFMILMAMVGLCIADVVQDTLSDAKKQGKIVMIEVEAAGCAGCDEMDPVIDKLRTDYKGKLEVLYIDARRNMEYARRFLVRAIPTQIFLDKNGKEFHRHMGFYAYEEIASVLKKKGM
jgi:thioredoxin 1